MNTALQILTVVLLLAVAGVLYVIYGQLTKIGRALGLQPPERAEAESESAMDVDPAASGVGAEFALGAAATPSAAVAGGSYDPPETDYPAAAYAESSQAEWTYDEGSSQATAAGAVIDDSGVIAASPPDDTPSAAPISSGPETSAVEPAIEAGVTQRPIEDEPEEQPFERDGRWWFKRGDELLVYDERSGQWQPGPSPTVQALATNPTSAQAGAITAELASLSADEPLRKYTTESGSEPEADEPEADEPAAEKTPASYETPAPASSAAEPAPAVEETAAAVSAPPSSTDAPSEAAPVTQEWTSGSFWKCPSCGAVNGSTATSCRMCFAARA